MSFLKKIMIVDDSQEMRDLLREYLNVLFGNRIVVREFDSASSAKNFVMAMDLVICDFEMKNGNGLDLYDFLLEQKSAQRPRMVMFTGRKEQLIPAPEGFFIGQINKTNIDDLITQIKSALDL